MTDAVARFVVSGRVQGVSFRACARLQARALGLRGHANNLRDGRVEVLAAGPQAAVDGFADWLWQGSPQAEVTDVQRVPASAADVAGDGFAVG